jgi:vancomycin resistance protein YoaR
VFGYPISEEFGEINAIDGRPYLVQYFERARFEYHPEYAGTRYQVLLGQLGDEYARSRGLAADLRAPAQPISLLGTATLTFAPDSSTGKNMRLAAAQLDRQIVKPGQALSYNQTLGEISARTGYLAAPAIVDGRIRDDIGGGICRVSTLLYRAAFVAGLPIEERHSHSRMIAYLRDQPGMDAAVYAPKLDLRWRNDMPSPITIAADVGDGNALTVTLWGVSDGRRTSVAKPKILKHAFTTDQPDIQSATYIQPAIDVVTGRVVRDAAGKVIRSEQIMTHYEPLEQAAQE